MPRPRDLPDRTDELCAALAEVYRDADALFDGWACPASTECCRFGITGREPYVTSIELVALRRAVAARGGARSWRRAAEVARDPVLVGGSPSAALGSAPKPPERRGTGRVALPVVAEERTCPMLAEGGRCAVYAARPLGCRTFYCDRAAAGAKVKQREINALVRRIREIAARHEPGGDGGRPLTRAL
jgi:Fe-S-cluster containining protein